MRSNFYLVIIIIFKFNKVIYSNKTYFENENDFTENISELEKIQEHFGINYKKLYNLRFDPTTLYNSTNDNLLQLKRVENNLNNSEIVNGIGHANSTIALSGTMQSQIFSNESFENTNIMKITQSKNTLSIIGKRLKDIFLNATSALFKSNHPSGKGLLNLFEVIKFENIPCTGSLNGLNYLNGTCYHELECSGLAGLVIGRCANGYGVCCVFKYSCGGITWQEISYFESPKFPTPTTGRLTCVFTVLLQPHVKQIRLDFLFFETRRPTKGDCIEDQFIISGQNSNFKIPILCGINTGQHCKIFNFIYRQNQECQGGQIIVFTILPSLVYIEVNNSPDQKIFLSFFGKALGGRAYSIRILQLKRDNLAPEGCLQYYTDTQGFVKSFNYDENGNIVESRVATYFNNLNYAICFKRAPDKCFITYSNDDSGTEFPFELINIDEGGNSLIPEEQAGVTIYNCPEDFIVINAERLCGYKLNDGSIIEDFTQNAPVTDFGNGPMILQVRTDAKVVGRGFKLFYTQDFCI